MRSRPAAHTEPVIPVRHRVWLRLIVVTSLLLVLAVYGTSAFVIRLATLQIRADASDRNYQLAMRAAQQIDSLVENATVDVSELANVVNLADLQPKPSADVVLESFVLSANDFAKLVIVGADGRVIADSVPGTVQISDLDPEAVLHARAGEPFTSTPVIDAGIPLVTLVVPLSRRTVHPASLVAELRLSQIKAILEDVVAQSGSDAFVVASDGSVMAGTSQDITGPLATAGNGLTVERPIRSLGWRVIVQPASTGGFLPDALFFRRSLTLGGLVLVVVTLLTILYVRTISRPLYALLRGTQIIAAGAGDYRISIRSKDEFGLLAQSFNSMVDGLRTRTKALEDSERNYRIVTESVNDIIFSLDAEGRFAFLNRRVEQILGYRPQEMIGRPLTDFVAPDGRDQLAAAFLAWSSDHRLEATPAELTLVSKSGVEVVVEYEGVPIHETDGEDWVYGVARDVTERDRLQERLRRREKLSSLGEIVSGVTHELRNAIAGIAASTELLKMRDRTGSEADLERVMSEASRAERIVNSLLDFSRGETQPLTPLNLNDVLNDVLELRRRDIEQADIELTMELDPDLPAVLADAGRIRQVFLNLITNAIQAMSTDGQGRAKPGMAEPALSKDGPRREAPLGQANPGGAGAAMAEPPESEDGPRREAPLGQANPGGAGAAIAEPPDSTDGQGTRSLIVNTAAWSGDVVASIWDTGTGIPKRVLPHVFDPFFTTKRDRGGTGLGLSVSLGIVQSLGGEIHVQSTDGRGSCFSVELPAAPANEEGLLGIVQESQSNEARSVSATDEGIAGARILVVEDEDSIREFVCNFLRSFGCETDGAPNVRDAMDLLDTQPAYDAVVSDFRMPEITGQGLYEWICLRKPMLKERIIFITGDSLNPTTLDFLRISGIPYLLKPVNSLVLLKAIKPLLAAGKLRTG